MSESISLICALVTNGLAASAMITRFVLEDKLLIPYMTDSVLDFPQEYQLQLQQYYYFRVQSEFYHKRVSIMVFHLSHKTVFPLEPFTISSCQYNGSQSFFIFYHDALSTAAYNLPAYRQLVRWPVHQKSI